MGLGAVIEAVTSIADVFTQLGKLIEYLIYGLFELLPGFIYILNPINIVNDSITGIFLAIKVVLMNIVGVFKGKKKPYNKCQDSGGGLFGFRRKKNSSGKIIKEEKCGGDKVCRRSNVLKYIIAILCPPLALFLHMGITGWYHVIICSLLTVYAYYFPGLMYCLLHIMFINN